MNPKNPNKPNFQDLGSSILGLSILDPDGKSHFYPLRHMLYLFICVFCICIFVFACLTHGNMIFVIVEQSSLQKYTTCWVFLALRHMLYLCVCVFCICIFVFACLTHGNIIFDILEQSSFQKYAT